MSDKQINNIPNSENTETSEVSSNVVSETSSSSIASETSKAASGASSKVISDTSSKTASDASKTASETSKVASDASKATSGTAKAASGTAKAASLNVKTKEHMWTKKDLDKQIRSFENQFSLIAKRNIKNTDKIKEIKESVMDLIVNFEENDICQLEENIIDTKEKIYQAINKMTRWEKTFYFSSLWGLTPIGTAIIAMILSFYLISSIGSFDILGVPIWASLIAVAGTSVQILIGVANDYKDDCMITEYKRLWYIVLPFVSFVFGFIAYLLTDAGLISLTNQNLNVSSSSLISVSTISPPAISVILCFLAGYATDWFMGLLLKYTSK